MHALLSGTFDHIRYGNAWQQDVDVGNWATPVNDGVGCGVAPSAIIGSYPALRHSTSDVSFARPPLRLVAEAAPAPAPEEDDEISPFPSFAEFMPPRTIQPHYPPPASCRSTSLPTPLPSPIEKARQHEPQRRYSPTISRADAEIITEVSTVPLELLLDETVGRVVPPSLSALTSARSARRLILPAGTYHLVWEDGIEVWPWSVCGNGWLRGQLKELGECCCGFAFKKGGRSGTYYKKPSVCRDHLSTCARLPAENPLSELCKFTRSSEKMIKEAREATKAAKARRASST